MKPSNERNKTLESQHTSFQLFHLQIGFTRHESQYLIKRHDQTHKPIF